MCFRERFEISKFKDDWFVTNFENPEILEDRFSFFLVFRFRLSLRASAASRYSL